jgi:ElaB/YqjD/DUF883 family membrane-anchored ribosome-binding protein
MENSNPPSENKDENKTESTTSATAGALVEDVNRLKQGVTQLTADAKAHGKAHIDAAQERFNKAVAAAKENLSTHPFAILGAGLVLGYLFGRRGSRRN